MNIYHQPDHPTPPPPRFGLLDYLALGFVCFLGGYLLFCLLHALGVW